jgi:hypothetical protein
MYPVWVRLRHVDVSSYAGHYVGGPLHSRLKAENWGLLFHGRQMQHLAAGPIHGRGLLNGCGVPLVLSSVLSMNS